jgi:hypothetical protein
MSLSLNFSAVCMHMTSKFIHKSIQEIQIFSNKANFSKRSGFSMNFKIFLSFFFIVSLNLWGENPLIDTVTGASFPSEVTFDFNGKSYHLEATGVATRKKLFIKVYSIAHYLQDGGDIAAILQDNKAKQFTIKWVYDVSVEKVQNAYREAFQNSFSTEELAKLQTEINQFLSYFTSEARRGDEYILRWIPGGITEVIINGEKKGDITNATFARGVWNIWFGSKSVVNKDNLVSLMK